MSYRSHRERKKGGAAGPDGGPPHVPHVMIVALMGGKKPKKRDGGKVDGTGVRHHLGRRARGGRAEDCMAEGGHVDKWIGPARERMERNGTVGSLHRILGVDEGEKIPEKKLAAAKARAVPGSKMAKKIQFAENVRR